MPHRPRLRTLATAFSTTVLTVSAVALVAAGITATAHAAEPVVPKTIRVVVPFPPSGSNDVFARLVSEKLSKKLGVTAIVDNKPGAGGAIGAEFVARSAPDGATLMITSSTFTGNAAVQPKTSYDVNKSFVPVAMLASGPMVLAVSEKSPYKTVADLIAAAKKDKGGINYGSSGIGSINQMSSELLAGDAGIEFTHVPYKGISNALTDLIAGQVQFVIASFPSVATQVKGGKLRALAVTSPTRSRFAPQWPAVAETVPNYSAELWWGVFAPAGTPQPLVEKLNAEIRDIIATPEMREIFSREGAEPSAMTAAQFAEHIRRDSARWKQVAKARNITAE
ncbi:tripartite tricarboxylate transporter substrate binding protein [Cupriavidus pauculus]|uniref:Tripartite tricarboxylate transporter substrate binding protein n=1 Tax=Cupriavidus pauculus TaxID=82633 RepID=A0A2N5C7V0_9BURK|nr:tripartite tricarboxylate transporter substrate binding protein [Cupriavidus pauculus]PLP98279.1 tripartite tricarboxylate transporter substrate binding protein [Cupriavidus pauculus]